MDLSAIQISHETLKEVYRALRPLPQFDTCRCPECQHENEFCTIDTYSKCAKCGRSVKLHSFGGGPEVQDVVSLVITWIEKSGRSSEIMNAHRETYGTGWEDWDEWFGDDEDHHPATETDGR